MKKTICTVIISIFAISLCWSQTAKIPTSDTVLTKKGNKVFVEFADEASREGETYFIAALKEWGYWNIVTNKDESQFVIVFNIEPLSGGLDKTFMAIGRNAFVILKTREDQEFKRSKLIHGTPAAYNGYSAIKDVSKNMVKKYFKKEFK